jgi:hypothetical protein
MSRRVCVKSTRTGVKTRIVGAIKVVVCGTRGVVLTVVRISFATKTLGTARLADIGKSDLFELTIRTSSVANGFIDVLVVDDRIGRVCSVVSTSVAV